MLNKGDSFPAGVEFKYIPVELEKKEDPLACSIPTTLKVDKLLDADKEGVTVLVSVPGAFTPTCTADHIPPFLNKLTELKKDKKITALVVLSANDPFVLNAWGKLLVSAAHIGSGPYPKVYFASDPMASFSQANDLSVDITAGGMGIRTSRYAIAIKNSNRELLYIGQETASGVSVSGVDAILQARL